MGGVEVALAQMFTIRDTQGAWLGHFVVAGGHLHIVSEWGSYQYFWSQPGDSMLEFLGRLDNGYLHGKLRHNAYQMGLKGAPLKQHEERLQIFLERVWPIFKAFLSEGKGGA